MQTEQQVIEKLKEINDSLIQYFNEMAAAAATPAEQRTPQEARRAQVWQEWEDWKVLHRSRKEP